MSSLSTKMIRWVGLGKVKKTIQEVLFLLCWYLVISSFYLIVSSFVFFWIFDYFVFFSLSSTPDPSLSGKHTSFLRSVNTSKHDDGGGDDDDDGGGGDDDVGFGDDYDDLSSWQ